MKGFKDFLVRGNLIELAVAFIMGAAFTAVVTAFTKIILDYISKVNPATEVGKILIGGVDWAPFLNALIALIVVAFVVYFGIVKPYEALRARKQAEGDPEAESSESILGDIRDLLAAQQGGAGQQPLHGNVPPQQGQVPPAQPGNYA